MHLILHIYNPRTKLIKPVSLLGYNKKDLDKTIDFYDRCDYIVTITKRKNHDKHTEK